MVFKAKTRKETWKFFSTVKAYSLPIYIVVSAVFILYVLWSYAMWVVYNAWVIAGQNQALQVGQEQGYVAAIEQMSQEASSSCDVVTLTLWDQEVNMINIDCLDMSGWNDAMMDDEFFFE